MLEWFPLTDVTAPAAGSQTQILKQSLIKEILTKHSQTGGPLQGALSSLLITHSSSKESHMNTAKLSTRLKESNFHMFSIFYQLNIRNKHQGVFQKSFSIIPIIQSKDWWSKSLRKNCWSQRVWHHTRVLPPHCTVPLTATVCLSLQLVSPDVCFKQPFIIFITFIIFIFFIIFITFSWKLCLTFVFAEFVLQTSQKVKLKSLQSFSHSE